MKATLVHPYDPAWPFCFDLVKAFLQLALTGIDCSFEHVGGTAIPGAVAKPIIDIDIVIAKVDFTAVKEQLESLG